MDKKIRVIHGPNLNMLGKREVELYGKETLEDIHEILCAYAEQYDITIETVQTNSEGTLISYLQEAYADSSICGVLCNPAAYSHYSIAIQDAYRLFSSTSKPIVEVHLTDYTKRESYRSVSITGTFATYEFRGKGVISYIEGLAYILEQLHY